MYVESNMETYITMCKVDSKWEFAVWCWELNPVLCDNPEGGIQREDQEGGDICISVAVSCWCMAEVILY